MSHIVVTGAQGGLTQGLPPNRLEIHDLIKNHQDQFSLYIQALIELQKAPQSNSDSFFGVGGIHGLPPERWEGSGGTTAVGSGGYCTHSTVLFPTWHRPYVALFEQLLQQQALKIVENHQESQDQARWLRAAQNLRAPYWDWATYSVPPPEVISLEYLDIITAKGKVSVKNPLLQYKFNPIHPSFELLLLDKVNYHLPFHKYETTLRYPKNFKGPDAKTDVPGLIASLKAGHPQRVDDTYHLLMDVHNWDALSNNTVGGGVPTNSLESIHNSIHIDIGGHMSDGAVAGFDPIFFLHHCNVDRILALWEALNPGVWVSRGSSRAGTFTIPKNTVLDANDNLTPFWDSQTTYWKSARAKTSAFKYSYPEFDGLDLGKPDAVKTAIHYYVESHYGSGGGASRRLLRAGPSTEGVQAQEASNVINYWSTRIHVKKFELSGSFSVLIFLGEVPDDPEQWCTSSSFVGAHNAFVNSAASQCDNCRSQADLVVEGFVHLTSAIEKKSLPSYEPSVVRSYLKDNLTWRILTIDRNSVEPASLPSLEVTVLSTPWSESPDTGLPVSGTPEYHPEITYGRPGGAPQAQA